MKKILPTGLFLALFSQVNAQITINASNLFDAGDRIINGVGVSNLDPNIVPGNSGTGQTWNFTTSGYDIFDTTDIYAPGWINSAYTAQCPQANLLMGYPSSPNNFDLVLADQNGFYLLGGSSYNPLFGVQTSLYQNPIDWMRWPATYGQSYIDTATGDNTIAVMNGSLDSTRSIISMIFTSDIDAYGTMVINSGSFNSLRLKRMLSYNVVSIDHDTLMGWLTPTTLTFNQTMYEWWTDSPGIGFPIVTIYMDQSNAVQQYNILHLSTTDVAEQNESESSFELYPSPTTSTINLKSDANGGEWQIMDISGRQVLSGVLSAQITEVDVTALPAGIYTVQITDAEGYSEAKKFIKQ